MKTNILFVDDEEDIINSFQRSFRKVYNLYTTTSPEEGLEIIKKTPDIAVIVSDFSMPKMNGLEFLAQTMILSPESNRIMLTGYSDINTILEAVNENKIYKFLLKPVPTEALKVHLEEAVEHYRLKSIEKELNSMKSNFLSVVSRNYRDPLTGIMNSSYLLKNYFDKNDKNEFDKSLNDIQHSILKMSSIIDKVINLSNLEIKYSILLIESNLDEYVKDSINHYKNKPNRNRIFDYKNLSDNCQITTDLNLLNIIFSNILDNAIKFSAEDSIISITITNVANKLALKVKDTGVGIPDNEKEFLFNPFFKSTINQNYDGSGLGLALVRKAIDILNLKIEINSTLGVGTEVIIYFGQR